MKTTRIVQFNGVAFQIVNDTGETIEHYTTLIAESLALKDYYEKQASAFRLQSQNERKKAQERITLLFNLREYNRQKKRDSLAGIVRKVSRMEPMEVYDERMLTEERNTLLDQSNDFSRTADKFAALSKKQDELAICYAKEIELLRDQKCLTSTPASV